MTQISPLDTARLNIGEITARIAKRNEDNALDQAVLEDWRAAERVFARLGGETAPPETIAIPSIVSPFRDGTTKDYLFRAMIEAKSNWNTATDIQAIASSLKGEEIPITAISPALSGMKVKGLIVRNGLKVALKARADDQASYIPLFNDGLPDQIGSEKM